MRPSDSRTYEITCPPTGYITPRMGHGFINSKSIGHGIDKFKPFRYDYKYKFSVSGQFGAVVLKRYVCLAKTNITDHTVKQFLSSTNVYFLGSFRIEMS